MVDVRLYDLPASVTREVLAVLPLALNGEFVHLPIKGDTQIDGSANELGGGPCHVSSLFPRPELHAEGFHRRGCRDTKPGWNTALSKRPPSPNYSQTMTPQPVLCRFLERDRAARAAL